VSCCVLWLRFPLAAGSARARVCVCVCVVVPFACLVVGACPCVLRVCRTSSRLDHHQPPGQKPTLLNTPHITHHTHHATGMCCPAATRWGTSRARGPTSACALAASRRCVCVCD
jgi:hypothetical protein